MSAVGGIILNPNGLTVVVTVTSSSGRSLSLYSDPELQTPAANPLTITTRTPLYVGERVVANVSCKLNGTEIATSSGAALSYHFAGGAVSEVGLSSPFSPNEDAADRGTYPSRIGGVSTLAAPLPFFNVKDYGAKGDGATDDSAAIQAAINAAVALVESTGGSGTGYGTSFMVMAEVFCPPGVYMCSGLSIPTGRIHFTGSGARLKANAAGYILSISGRGVRVSGLMLDGNGVAMVSAGLYAQNCNAAHVHDLKFHDFAGRAILWDTSANGIIDNIMAQNCLLDPSVLVTYAGVVEIRGIDSTFRDSEITASRVTMSSTGFAGALVVTGGNNWIGPSVQAEISDFGVYINAALNADTKVIGVRADLNMGHGFIVAGGTGLISDCHSHRNGQAAPNTYHGYFATGGQFEFNNCIADASPASQHLVAFKDTQNALTTKNSYKNCRSFAHSLQAFDFANVGPYFTLPPQSWGTAATSTAAISVDQVSDLRLVNTSAFTVTSLTKGANGQIVRLYGDGFTTIQNNSTHLMAGGRDLLLANDRVYTFIRQNGVWRHLSEGDSAAPVRVGANAFYYTADGGADTPVALAAGTVYYVPVLLTGKTINQLALNITTAAAAGKLVNLGIYSMLSTGLPGTKLVELGTPLAADAIAGVSGTISYTPNGRTWAWLACVTDGTPTVTCLTVPIRGLGRASVTAGARGSLVETGATGTTLPATASGAVFGSGISPAVMFRLT